MQAKLIETRELTTDVRHLVFEAGEERLDFVPGQFLRRNSHLKILQTAEGSLYLVVFVAGLAG